MQQVGAITIRHRHRKECYIADVGHHDIPGHVFAHRRMAAYRLGLRLAGCEGRGSRDETRVPGEIIGAGGQCKRYGASSQ